MGTFIVALVIIGVTLVITSIARKKRVTGDSDSKDSTSTNWKWVIIIIIASLTLVAINYFSGKVLEWIGIQNMSFTVKLIFTGIFIYILSKLFGNNDDANQSVSRKISEIIIVLVVIFVVMSTGFYENIQSWLDSSDESASCSADPTQERCVVTFEEDLVPKPRRAAVVRMAQPTHALTEDCKGDFARFGGCERVSFRGDSYIRTTKKGMCIGYNMKSLVSTKKIAPRTYEFTARKGSRPHLFDLKIGEKYDGATCK